MKSGFADVGIMTVIIALFIVIILSSVFLSRNVFHLRCEMKRHKTDLHATQEALELVAQETEIHKNLFREQMLARTVGSSAPPDNTSDVDYNLLQNMVNKNVANYSKPQQGGIAELLSALTTECQDSEEDLEEDSLEDESDSDDSTDSDGPPETEGVVEVDSPSLDPNEEQAVESVDNPVEKDVDTSPPDTNLMADEHNNDVPENETKTVSETSLEDQTKVSHDNSVPNSEGTEIKSNYNAELQKKIEETVEEVNEEVKEEEKTILMSKNKKKKTSNTPNDPAKNFENGMVIVSENDFNEYQVMETKNGIKKWKKISKVK